MKTTMLLALAATAAFATPALAQPEAGRWSGSISAGADLPVGGDVHGGAVAPVADLGPLNPALAGVSAELRIGSRSFDDIYGQSTSVAGELAYGLSSRDEMFVQLRYQGADEGSVQVGGAFVPALNTELPVYGTFGDLQAYSLEVGYRRYFGEGAWKPYVAGRAGLSRTEDIQASFAIPAAGIAINDAPFYEASTSGVLGLDLGVSYAVSDQVSFTAETGLRWTSALSDDDAAIGGLGLAAINDESDRLDVPVRVGLRATF